MAIAYSGVISAIKEKSRMERPALPFLRDTRSACMTRIVLSGSRQRAEILKAES
jgi:hypothetical protein